MVNILLVDDQQGFREFLSAELSCEGYRVLSVGDAESIWGHLRDSRLDLVLLDLYMDGLEGFELLRDIKSEDPNLPVLIVTAYDSYAEDPRLSQADGYVIKNFDCVGLKQKIANVLKKNILSQPEIATC